MFAPNLHRAVAECTQPYCAAPASATRTLQKYLSDGRCVDLVYLAVLSRAAAQPVSEAVVAKCAALLKANLSRHTPSRSVLQAVQAGARRLAAALSPSSDVAKSLLFLSASAARLLSGPAAAAAPAAADDDGTSRAAATAAEAWRQRGATVADSYASVRSSAGRPLAGSPPPLQQRWQEPDEGQQAGPEEEAELMALGAARPVISEDGAPPPWALAADDLPWPHLVAAAASAEAEAGADGAAHSDGAGANVAEHQGEEVDWAELVPGYSGSLAPLLQGACEERGGALPAFDCAEIIAGLTDLDPESALDQMLDIAAAKRDQLCAAADEALGPAPAACPRPVPVHLVPYSQQAPLAGLPPGDVAAVLEVVLGRAGGGAAASAVSGRWDEEAPEAHWVRPPEAGGAGASAGGGRRSSTGGAAAARESLGQTCACILAKLVVDTWLAAGHAAAPVALRMLQQALHHPHPAVRARPFDLLFNLSIHAALLAGADGEGLAGPDAAPARGAAVGAGALAPPSAPPELAGQLYARPPSPAGAQRQRGGGSPTVAVLAAPRIHLPPQVMATGGPGSSGSSAGGGSSPRSPAGNGAGGPPSPRQQPTPQLQQGLASPRSRLARGGDAAGVPGSPMSSGATGATGEDSGGLWGLEAGALESEFEAWLRQLLFELLVMLSQLDEKSEQVWQSAAGATLHLTTHAGYWVRDAAAGLPLQALRGLMRACLAFDWAPELHARFAQIVPLLLCPLGGVERRLTSESGRKPSGSGGGDGSGTGTPLARRVTGATDGSGWEFSGVDARLLEAFGGAEELLHHFCHAASPEAQRCLLLPLLERCMPPGTAPSAAARAALGLGGSPARLSALQAALRSGRPGLADPLLSALAAAPGLGDGAQLQLLCSLVLALEGLATAGAHATGAGDELALTAAGGAASPAAGRSRGGGRGDGATAAAVLRGAVDLTKRHLAGTLPESEAPHAAAAWRALRELAWCGGAAPRAAAADWLQQLLAVVLEATETGGAPLPLPPGPAPADAPAGVAAFVEALMAVVPHCPWGPDALVDALQLHLTAAGPWAGDAELHASGEDDAAAVEADLRSARSAARAWALVLQWVAHAAPRSAARGALARLADVGVSLLCWPSQGDDAAAACSGSEPAGRPAPAGLGERTPPASPGGVEGRADACGSEACDQADQQPSDAVCRPQGFLAGQQLIAQESLEVVGLEPVVALVVRLLACRTPAGAAARGFTTRIELGPGPSALAPASDAVSDLQLSLLLFVIAACSGDDAAYDKAGMDGLMRQMLTAAMDVRQCYYLSSFVLEQLMLHRQGRYWAALKQLLLRAQEEEDERMLGNPFLQLQALFGG
ncbi:hypothetical protein Rsub_07435 [Raphidocelis subcapitata]|uniref:Uncharacterized protein n=1 Tax=Raphidocelis subcapitata TaxID=307507 RepID=A0A2V0P551_9CHLO|nr:hypothetical protein Rsub_07435 [Raphidocelis subcapitata]|eukprot:GBF94699.1 hypothetical protein Rsub_07435 [Raphidocelis subcapitata]